MHDGGLVGWLRSYRRRRLRLRLREVQEDRGVRLWLRGVRLHGVTRFNDDVRRRGSTMGFEGRYGVSTGRDGGIQWNYFVFSPICTNYPQG